VSGRLKKIIWMLLMVELVIIHIAVLVRLYLHGHKLALVIFVGGSLLMAIVQYLSYRFFIKNCVRDISKLEDDKVKDAFNETINECKAGKCKARLYENSQTATPFVMGIFHQSIILPKECRKYPHLKLILLHEIYHVKRRDTLYKYIMLTVNCFLWFHPLAYFIRYISYQDIEISCDEAVVRGKSKKERLEYGEFLIASARNIQTKNNAFNAYWNSSKSILKHRIDAVFNENGRWDTLAKIAIIVLALEAIILSVVLTKNLFIDYEKVTAPTNEYEGVIAPPIYNDEAIQQMLTLEPVEENAYCLDLFGEYDNQYPEKEFTEIEAQAQNPWQIKVKRPGPFGNAADIAIQRLYYYMENQTDYNSIYYEQSPYNTTYELVYRTLLAGDIDNSVWGYIWKVYCADPTASKSLNNGYAFTKDGEENYLYFTTAVQIKMVEPYLFEAAGYADLYQVLDAYEQKYETDFFHYIPQVVNVPSATKSNLDLEEQEALANAFAETKGMWDVRISFPENNQEGYLLGVIDKAVMQVYCILYKTEDGGKSWRQVEMDTAGTEHRQTYDFSFVSNKEGYVAIYSFSNDTPCMLRTEDGGVTWEPVQFSEEIIDFCQAFAPVYDGDKYIVFVGKEGSSRDKGEKACYESSDGGKTWDYTGQVTFD
jgi:beta-lactamase regulating signal transducer with metallopeptidase domain